MEPETQKHGFSTRADIEEKIANLEKSLTKKRAAFDAAQVRAGLAQARVDALSSALADCAAGEN